MGHNPHELEWSHEDIEKLKHLWDLEVSAPALHGSPDYKSPTEVVRKLSTSEIALRFGGTRSKNSIIGKVRRLADRGELTHRPSPLMNGADPTLRRAREYAARRARRLNGPPSTPSLPKLKSLEQAMPMVAAPKRAASPKPKPVPALRFRPPPVIGATPCRWPMNDCRPWLFCEAPSNWDRPYCDKHCQIAYVSRLSLPIKESLNNGFASF